MKNQSKRIIVLTLLVIGLLGFLIATRLLPLMWAQRNQADYVGMAPIREVVQRLTQPQLALKYGLLGGYRPVRLVTGYQSPGTVQLGQFKRIRIWSEAQGKQYLEVWVGMKRPVSDMGLEAQGNHFYITRKIERRPAETEVAYHMRWRHSHWAREFPTSVHHPLLGSGQSVPIRHVHLIGIKDREVAQLWVD